MRSRKLVASMVAIVVALSVQSISVAKPSAGNSTAPVIKPPYSESFASPPSDVCGGDLFGDPQCTRSAEASTDGSLAARAAISGSSRRATFTDSFTASGATSATALVRQYINNPTKKGATLTVRLSVEVPEATAFATSGDHAEVSLQGTLGTNCYTADPTDCHDSETVIVAGSSGASACRPECVITLSIKAPADKPLGGGNITLYLDSLAELKSRQVLLPTSTEASATGRAFLRSIELVRS